MSKSLAQINKSPDVGKATKKRSAPVDAEHPPPAQKAWAAARCRAHYGI
jgi:hypothetical protein